MSKVHEYRCQLEWSGSTANGLEHYDRAHRVSCPPAETTMQLSGDPAFHGDATMLSPEQLLLSAASSCQMLAFLAIVARAGIEVVSYVDDAHAVMPEDDRPMRITEITLRPHIVVADGTDEGLVHEYLERGHKGCFIANSLGSKISIEPRIEHASASTADRAAR